MSYVFTINKKGTAVLHPDSVKLCPEFAYLDPKEILCIVLATDYYSIFRQFAEDERQRRARANVYGTDNENFFQLPKIKKAVEAYKSLQFDPRREQIITYKRKLQELDGILSAVDEDDFKKIKDVISSQKELRKAIAEVEDELIKSDQDEEIETDDKSKLSFLEKLQANKQRYMEVTAKRVSNKVPVK